MYKNFHLVQDEFFFRFHLNNGPQFANDRPCIIFKNKFAFINAYTIRKKVALDKFVKEIYVI